MFPGNLTVGRDWQVVHQSQQRRERVAVPTRASLDAHECRLSIAVPPEARPADHQALLQSVSRAARPETNPNAYVHEAQTSYLCHVTPLGNYSQCSHNLQVDDLPAIEQNSGLSKTYSLVLRQVENFAVNSAVHNSGKTVLDVAKTHGDRDLEESELDTLGRVSAAPSGAA